jgi:hypothetical protein
LIRAWWRRFWKCKIADSAWRMAHGYQAETRFLPCGENGFLILHGSGWESNPPEPLNASQRF